MSRSRSVRLTHSQVLRLKIQLTSECFRSALELLWRRPDIKRVFPRFLLLLHQIMRASVPLMEVALGCAEQRAGTDKVCAGMLGYLATHIAEERHHDTWTLDDLVAAGVARADALAQVPSPAVAALVGAQYYWIQHHHPVALLGYMGVLEGSPPSQAHIDRLRAASGLPDDAFRTYRKHGRLDVHHTRSLDHLLDGLPLSRAQVGLLGLSSAHTARMLAESIDELLEA
jgi:hypothetical protein